MRTLISILLLGAVLSAGCVSKDSLDPAGAYKSDATLFNADRTITTTYTVFDTFLRWELANRASLPPSVTKLADNIRVNAQHWFSSAEALRDAYKASPTAENKASLQTALNVIQAALTEAETYMAQPIQNK